MTGFVFVVWCNMISPLFFQDYVRGISHMVIPEDKIQYIVIKGAALTVSLKDGRSSILPLNACGVKKTNNAGK